MIIEKPWSVLLIEGENNVSFLQGLFTNDISALQPCYGAFLNNKGRFLADAMLIPGTASSWITTHTNLASALYEHLKHYALFENIQITPCSYKVATSKQPLKNKISFEDPRHKSLGFWNITDESLPTDSVDDPFALTRISLGIAEGDTIPSNAIILEYGFQNINGLSWTKGCYLGQELIARTHYRGSLRKSTTPFVCQSCLQPNTRLISNGEDIGYILETHKSHGLAMAHKSHHNCDVFSENGDLVSLKSPFYER